MAITFLIFVKFLGLIITKQEIKFRKFKHGIDGENDISRVLKELPDSFSVFRGLGFREHCDIDFIVVGPTGVFTVEVKSHKGKVEFNGNELTLNGRLFEKDFLRQAFAEAMDLKDYLFQITHKEIFVAAIVVFSNEGVSVNVESSKLRNVYVVQKDRLLNIINMNDHSCHLDMQKISFIEGGLKGVMARRQVN